MRSLCLTVVLAIQILPALVRAQAPYPFIGGWDWVRTEYADGRVETPETLGYSQQYYFADTGACIVYHDMVPARQGLWYLGEVLVGPCLIEHMSFLDDPRIWYWNLASGDPVTLILTDGLNAQPCGVDVSETTRLTLTYFGTVPDDVVGWGTLQARYR